jgi:hypothetical protein
MVWGEITSTMSFSFPPVDGAHANVSPWYQGLGASGAEATSEGHVTYLQTVVLAVPPAGSSEPLRVLGVAHAPVEAGVSYLDNGCYERLRGAHGFKRCWTQVPGHGPVC